MDIKIISVIVSIFGLVIATVNVWMIYALRNLSAEIKENKKTLTIDLKETTRRVESLEQRKTDCQRDFVSSEAWVRSEGYTRHKLDQLIESVATMAGSLKIVEQLPQIMGQITREIFKAAKEGKL